MGKGAGVYTGDVERLWENRLRKYMKYRRKRTSGKGFVNAAEMRFLVREKYINAISANGGMV